MLSSLHGIMVNQDSYETLVNFCEDRGIENVPIRQNMFFPLRIADEYEERLPQFNKTTYNVMNLRLEVVDAISGEGKTLIAVGDCPPLVEVKDELSKGTDEEDEPFEYVEFVLSNDFDETGFDIDMMNAKLKEYVEFVSFAEFFTRYLDADDIFEYVLDGRFVED